VTARRRIYPGAAALAFALSFCVCMIQLLLLQGCGSGGVSTAADPYISQAADGEEREGLTQARDDIDAEMREEAEELDREIERLRKENEELKAKLAEKRK